MMLAIALALVFVLAADRTIHPRAGAWALWLGYAVVALLGSYMFLYSAPARRRAGRHDAHLAGHPSAAGRRPAGVRLLARRRRGRRGGRGPPRPDDVRTGLEAALLDRHEARAERPPGELRAGAADFGDSTRMAYVCGALMLVGLVHRLRRPEPADPRRRRGDRLVGG